MDYTPAEQMVVCMAREIQNGDILAQGIATRMTISAAMLAKRTHAPNVYFANSIGNSLTNRFTRVSLTGTEKDNLDMALSSFSFCHAVCEFLPRIKPKEFFRPAQIDSFGNTNNILIGTLHDIRLRLPGAAGIPDVSTYWKDAYLYVSHHSRKVFVPKVDFISGIANGRGLKKVITNLAVFNFDGNGFHIESIHDYTTLEEVIDCTGFPLTKDEPVPKTKAPTPEELRILRTEVDPNQLYNLEMLSGSERIEKLVTVIANETKQNSK